jgi:hypothetical protein
VKHKLELNKFLPIGKTNATIHGFLYETARARKSKYAVHTCPNRGEILVLFTFASTYEEAFQIAKSAYQESSYPKVGVGHFVVHGICKSSTCRCGGEWRTETFLVDWSTSL